jgi:hypothetical protein
VHRSAQQVMSMSRSKGRSTQISTFEVARLRVFRLRDQFHFFASYTALPLGIIPMSMYLHRSCSIYIQLSLRAEPLTVALEDAANLLYSVCRWPGASRNDTRHPLYSPRNIHGSSFIASTNPQGACRDRNITSRIAGSAFEQSWGRQPGKQHR